MGMWSAWKASSPKQQASSSKLQACGKLTQGNMPYWHELRAPSTKPQALMSGSGLLALGPGAKPQASSVRQIVARQYVLLTQAPSTKLQATSTKRQATWLNFFWISDHESASGQLVRWPSVERSRTREPGKSFTHLWPRALIRIKVFLGWDKWKAIWCGENLTKLPFVTFNSTVKKWLELL